MPSFRAMVAEIHRISGVPIAELVRAFRRVHQKHGTTEYAFAIEELDILDRVDSGLSPEERVRKYDSAIHAFRSARKRLLRTYPGVRETLRKLRAEGVNLIAHSDAMAGYVSRRLRQLEIDTLFDALCAARDHGVPPYLSLDSARQSPEEEVAARIPVIELPDGVRKPSPKALEIVLEKFNVQRARAVYVGDSISRDVLLARRVGVIDVWAAYGHTATSPYYKDLVEITFWTEAEVAEEERLRAEIATVTPSHVINSFSEVLGIVGIP